MEERRMTPEETDFHALIEVIDRLLAPDGCPWDREQTVHSWAHMVLEEVYEVIDTLSEAEPDKLADELGDLVTGALFLTKAAEVESRFSWNLPFKKAAEKLIRRHPHIFGGEKALTDAKAVEKKWEEIKATEVHHVHRKSRFDGFPKSLPALALMQKLVHKAKKVPELAEEMKELVSEQQTSKDVEFARRITQVIMEAEQEGVQAELALRHYFGICREELMKKESEVSGVQDQ
jgi:uncharacterized protein YabN with tetrapyrrole methylase and pyrophosphatase domain